MAPSSALLPTSSLTIRSGLLSQDTLLETPSDHDRFSTHCPSLHLHLALHPRTRSLSLQWRVPSNMHVCTTTTCNAPSAPTPVIGTSLKLHASRLRHASAQLVPSMAHLRLSLSSSFFWFSCLLVLLARNKASSQLLIGIAREWRDLQCWTYGRACRAKPES